MFFLKKKKESMLYFYSILNWMPFCYIYIYIHICHIYIYIFLPPKKRPNKIKEFLPRKKRDWAKPHIDWFFTRSDCALLITSLVLLECLILLEFIPKI